MKRASILSLVALVVAIFSSTASGQIERCGTPDPSQIVSHNPLYRITGNTTIPAILHVIYRSDSTGYVSESVLQDQIDTLNAAFSRSATKYSFYMAGVNWTQNDIWHGMIRGSQRERDMTNSLAVDPKHALNIYIGDAEDPYLGWVINWPWDVPEDSNQNGVVLDYGSLPGGYKTNFNEGDTGPHEVGHYLGLYHTFENSCSAPGDTVDDTPYHEANYRCPSPNPDSCPNDPGLDPIHNYLNYTYDTCMSAMSANECNGVTSQLLSIDIFH